jgi:single-stranded-DNA-specific exonuclease
MKKITLEEFTKNIKDAEAKTKEGSDLELGIIKMTDKLMSIDKPKIKILTDYDADGITSAFILARTLGLKYPDRDISIECNDRRGSYGTDAFAKRGGDFSDTQVVILDMGSNEYKENFKVFGDDTFIIDHHLINDEDDKKFLVTCDNVLNPKKWENPAEYCTAGLAYRIFQEVDKRQAEYGVKVETFTRNDMTIMGCIGTCADVVDLLDTNGYNRDIVKKGLDLINDDKIQVCYTIRKLLDLNFNTNSGRVTANMVAFNAGAFLNAPSRMSEILGINGAQMCMDTLFEEGSYDDSEYSQHIIKKHLTRISEINECRKGIMSEIKESGVFKNAVEYYLNSSDSLVIYELDSKYPHNFCGLVAGVLAEQTGKACICVMENSDHTGYSGSGRNVPSNTSLKAYLDKVFEGMDVIYGGHNDAVGISFLKDLGEFQARVEETPLEKKTDYEPLYLDVDFSDKKLVEKLYAIEPLGSGVKLPPVILKGKLENIAPISTKKDNPKWKKFTVSGNDVGVKDWSFDENKYLGNKDEKFFVCNLEVSTFQGEHPECTVINYPAGFENEIAKSLGDGSLGITKD